MPQFNLGTPAAHASNAVPPFQVVTPAAFLAHLSLIINACGLNGILMPAEKFVDNPWTFGPTGWQILRRDGQAIRCFMSKTGGGSGIRTHDTVARIAVFKSVDRRINAFSGFVRFRNRDCNTPMRSSGHGQSLAVRSLFRSLFQG